jgi:hypothetical protein
MGYRGRIHYLAILPNFVSRGHQRQPIPNDCDLRTDQSRESRVERKTERGTKGQKNETRACIYGAKLEPDLPTYVRLGPEFQSRH